MPKVTAINISAQKGVIKKPIPQGEFIENFGLKEDAHGGEWHRQVSLLAQESIEKMIAMGVEDLTPGKFAENLTTEGIELHTLPVGTQFEVNGVLMEVTQIGKECHKGCAIKQQVGKCIMPTEGIFAKVIKGGMINPGDDMKIIEN